MCLVYPLRNLALKLATKDCSHLLESSTRVMKTPVRAEIRSFLLFYVHCQLVQNDVLADDPDEVLYSWWTVNDKNPHSFFSTRIESFSIFRAFSWPILFCSSKWIFSASVIGYPVSVSLKKNKLFKMNGNWETGKENGVIDTLKSSANICHNIPG